MTLARLARALAAAILVAAMGDAGKPAEAEKLRERARKSKYRVPADV